MNKVKLAYRRMLVFPRTLLCVVGLLVLPFAWYLQDFRFDASSDTLVVRGDPKLETYERMTEQFGGDEFLVIAYTPRTGDLFTRSVLDHLGHLQADVAALDGISATFSILDAPLVQSPAIPLEQMSDEYRTLRDPDVDLELACKELTSSPLFRNFLISENGQASVIRVDLERNDELADARERREALRDRRDRGEEVSDELAAAEAQYTELRTAFVDQRQQLIDAVRAVRDRYSASAIVHVSGVPMIAADMIEFVKSDIQTFGGLVFFVVLALLFFFFRRLRWVFLPIAISGLTILITMGLLGYVAKPVTVISSNFISLLAIICISFSIHLMVRYRELRADDEDTDQCSLVLETMESKFAPCLYTGLTTMLAFGSMLGSSIVPVEDFGWMMCLGIAISFVITYTVFPAVLLWLGKGRPAATLGEEVPLTIWLCHAVTRHSITVLLIAVVTAGAAGYGLTRISFDNRFIDYFDDSTEIHRGMAFIDRHLGGTIPFDVFLQLGAYDDTTDGADDFFSSPGGDAWSERYWFTRTRIDTVAGLHQMIDQRRSTGKVISISTLEQLAQDFNDGEPLSNVEMAYALGALPEDIRQQLVLPYANPETGLARINARIQETGPRFSKTELIDDVRQYAETELGLAPDEVVITGMMVLFNDMLQRLADSQARTLFYVILATFVMFVLLLRAPYLAVLALVPNVIAAATVISVMGYLSIPLDMMTITIAAISIGIGVDDAIHYLHRFREELRERGDVRDAVAAAHRTIGRAMYYTSVIIMAGFSILAFSNFLPTVYFGLLTALAMMLALLANLTVLPALLVRLYSPRLVRAAKRPEV